MEGREGVSEGGGQTLEFHREPQSWRERGERGREGGREGERERDGFFVSAPHQPISAWAPIVLGGVLRPQFCNASN